ncbi:uncharacterized protein LOC131682836 [Topomyia yanbarensis]|uniref:uncharacterized protein LOC131682836 n=1 Tax=Topomyia yanbarensis TaxID=2498891 RepID=UPI00273B431D|nr:uncharacterized protein LOC131682836 [Topomyia yanbarensis]
MELFNMNSESDDDILESCNYLRATCASSWIEGNTVPLASTVQRSKDLCSSKWLSYSPKESVVYVPYRTNAFFGFRSSMKMPLVQHFHISTIPSNYLRRRRSASVDDVFASERYLSMSNGSLNRIIRRKLDFDHQQFGSISHYRRSSELDFERLGNINRCDNLERLSEVCDDHLRNIQYTNIRNTRNFFEKLCYLQYSRPETSTSIRTAGESSLDIDTSLLNRTRDLFSEATSSVKLDSVDIKILEKIDHHSRTYGSLPELYHRIGEQILSRRNYDDIEDFDVYSPKVACSTQTDPEKKVDDEEYHSQDVETQTWSIQSDSSQQNEHNELLVCHPHQGLLNKTLKNRRNRNFVLENIEKVRSKKSHFAKRNKNAHEKSSKKLDSTSSRTLVPKIKTPNVSRKFLKQNLKRRSLQFTTDEDDEHFDECSSSIQHDVYQKIFLNKICNDQAQCITEMGDAIHQIQNSVIEIAQLHDEIDTTRSNHLESASLMAMENCQRVNNTTFDATD